MPKRGIVKQRYLEIGKIKGKRLYEVELTIVPTPAYQRVLDALPEAKMYAERATANSGRHSKDYVDPRFQEIVHIEKNQRRASEFRWVVPAKLLPLATELLTGDLSIADLNRDSRFDKIEEQFPRIWRERGFVQGFVQPFALRGLLKEYDTFTVWGRDLEKVIGPKLVSALKPFVSVD